MSPQRFWERHPMTAAYVGVVLFAFVLQLLAGWVT